jgi:medium-chain acyl-[acyl-carrier-protein] hydrolase
MLLATRLVGSPFRLVFCFSMLDATWLPYRRAQPSPSHRLFCFAHAGGSASLFRSWQAEVPSSVEICAVQLPGRERRFREPPRSNLRALVSEIADAWQETSVPFACFGVSLGGWLEFELARELRRRGRRGPSLLIVAAMIAPDLRDLEDESTLSLDEWIARSRSRLELTEEEAHARELLEMLHPVIQADAALTEKHVYVEDKPLDCPISAYALSHDRRVEADAVRQWARFTTNTFKFAILEGEHNFVKTTPSIMFEPLREDLALIGAL